MPNVTCAVACNICSAHQIAECNMCRFEEQELLRNGCREEMGLPITDTGHSCCETVSYSGKNNGLEMWRVIVVILRLTKNVLERGKASEER